MKFISFKKDEKLFYGVIENDMIYEGELILEPTSGILLRKI